MAGLVLTATLSARHQDGDGQDDGGNGGDDGAGPQIVRMV